MIVILPLMLFFFFHGAQQLYIPNSTENCGYIA
jgi:hypothetical protein